MTDARTDNRKYIVGWLMLKPGQGREFVRIARAYAAECRKEDGCIFFEMNQSIDNPDVFVVSECFRNPEAHEAHLKRPLFIETWKELERIALSGRFENIYADSVTVDDIAFPGQ